MVIEHIDTKENKWVTSHPDKIFTRGQLVRIDGVTWQLNQWTTHIELSSASDIAWFADKFEGDISKYL